MIERRFRVPLPVDLRLTLGPLARPRTMAVADRCAWRATNTPDGPATLRLAAFGETVLAQAWGPGAAWALEGAPALAGALDSIDGFAPAHPIVRDLHRRLGGLRMARTNRVFEAALIAVCEQKVTGFEARRSYRLLVSRYGAAAPGPCRLRLPPRPEVVASLGSAALVAIGIDHARAAALRAVAHHAEALERLAQSSPRDLMGALQTLPRIGPWTAAEVATVVAGDPDAVSVGDYHLPNTVCWALAGEARGDDRRMLELLEPYRGHRGRVTRLLEAGHVSAPRFGPRMPARALPA